MHNQLRLAQMRGSLQAPNSPVQDRGLEYLDMIEEIERRKNRGRDEIDRVRALVLEYGAETVKETGWYADSFADPNPETDDMLEAEDIEWSTPTTPEDGEDITDWINSHMQGAMSGDQDEPEWN